jgi:alkanesulfonate monooxygenase SsuD/methylene tetrahydromethanopterin reductase-like flavin-dependent oxidoreductase (luciferase family)
MKFGLFSFIYYAGSEPLAGGLIAPKHYRTEQSLKSLRFNFELFERADALGFDWVSVSEHHYSTAMTPSPIVAAAALSQRVHHADIAVLGPNVPFHNPVRVAEELAMLDNLSGGRLIVALLRGTPPEYLTYGTNPAESRPMFEEAVELMLRAWSEPEPFGWEGVHYRFRTIAVSPTVIQKPRPRILVSGNSLESLEFAARHRFDLGFSFANPATAGKHFAIYKEKAKGYGWTPSADNVLYRHYCYIAESDAAAAEANERYGYYAGYGGRSLVAPTRPEAMPATPTTVADAIGGIVAQSRDYGDTKNSAIDRSIPPIIGSPDTVLRRLEELREVGNIGRVDLIFSSGRLPEELALKSLTLFAKEVFPAMQTAKPNAAE